MSAIENQETVIQAVNSLHPTTLFHFTKNEEAFYSILTELYFKPFLARERIVGVKGRRNFAVPMVSFCDIKLSQIKDHSEKYGEFGGSINGIEVYKFPTIERLAQITEEEFRACKVGFRAPYLVDACRKLGENVLDQNELKKCSEFWNDGKSVLFFHSLKYEKMHVEETNQEMKKVHDIYRYLYEKYIEIGNEIKYELTSKDSIIIALNNYINRFDVIIRKYNSLDLSFCPESIIIEQQKNNLLHTKNLLIETKNNINNTFQNIDNIEKYVKDKINEINITIINEYN